MHGRACLALKVTPRRVLRSFRSCGSLRNTASAAGAKAKGTTVVKPYYITTPIFYPNAEPHIGHLHSLVMADILARFARISGSRHVHFMTGTDEHGLKIQRAAQAKGMKPQAFCDQLSESFRALAKTANISNTMFSRTTDEKHCDAVRHLWLALDRKGLIYQGRHAGWYSVPDECFYTDLQVTEVIPSVGAEAYHISTETGSRVEWMEETNYKFRLSKFRSVLAEHYAAHEESIYPPQHRSDIIAALTQPLDDLSVSRPKSRLSWGVPVPRDAEHTIYVWIDALTVYLSSVGYPFGPQSEGCSSAGWPPDVQVIGKDILRFHALYLPAMLSALELSFSNRLLCHSHWTVDRAKMSKSVGNVADPIQAMEEFGVDIVRYYLARVGGRFKDDVDWSREQLEKHSKEIIAAFGNLYSRNVSDKILQRVKDRALPTFRDLCVDPVVAPLMQELLDLPRVTEGHMRNLEIADALERIVGTLKTANVLMTKTAPWNADKTPMEVAVAVHSAVLHSLRICGVLLQPFMPEKSALLLDQLGISRNHRTLEFTKRDDAPLGELGKRMQIF